MPRKRQKGRKRRLTPDDFFICGWLVLMTGPSSPEYAKAAHMETDAEVREAWEVCRDKLMELCARSGKKPWAFYRFDATAKERAAENKRREAEGLPRIGAKHE